MKTLKAVTPVPLLANLVLNELLMERVALTLMNAKLINTLANRLDLNHELFAKTRTTVT